MSNPKNNSAIVTILNSRVTAIQKYMGAEKAAIPVNGTMMKPPALVKLYQKCLKARGHVGARRDRLAVDENLRAWLLGGCGAGSAEAGEFGFAPRKAPTVSAATRAHAVE